MNKLLPLLLAFLLLTGCHSKTGKPSTTAPTEDTPVLWEVQLPATGYTEIITCDDTLILLRSSEDMTFIDLFSLETKEVTSSLDIPGILSSKKGTIQADNNRITYFDEASNCIVFLDHDLNELDRVHVPESHNGTVVISSDMKNAYFCSDNGIHAMNLENGITRVLKDQKNAVLSGCLFGTDILVCGENTAQAEYFYAEDGRIFTLPKDAEQLQTDDEVFTARINNRWENYRIIGKKGEITQVFLPEADDFSVVSGLNAIIGTKNDPGCTTISAYDIVTGKQIADYPTKASKEVFGFQWDDNHSVLLYLTSTVFDKYSICCLDLQKTQTTKTEITVSAFFTPDNPDLEGISSLQDKVTELNNKYRVDISLSPVSYSEITNDYQFTEEYRSLPYDDALIQLEAALERIAMCDLEKAAKSTSDGKIHIGIFNQVLGDYSHLNHGHFWAKGSFYIALSCGDSVENQFYHALGIFLESRVNSLGNYFDDWDELNPDDFSYLLNYRNIPEKLDEDEQDYFASILSLISPSEDRAELFRLAMDENSAELFDRYPLQEKLQKLCKGLRNIFQLSSETEVPWESSMH